MPALGSLDAGQIQVCRKNFRQNDFVALGIMPSSS